MRRGAKMANARYEGSMRYRYPGDVKNPGRKFIEDAATFRDVQPFQ